FFFSSRRRHTRFSRDWSSDVCSSDLRCTCPARCHQYRRGQSLPFRMDGSLRIRGGVLRTWDAFTSKKYKFILRPQAHTCTWVEVERTRRMCPVYFDGSQFRTKLNITPITAHKIQKQLFNLCIVLALAEAISCGRSGSNNAAESGDATEAADSVPADNT